MEKSGAKAYLVNTGWNGTGKRISIKDTRGIIDAILNGDIKNAPTKTIPYFNFEVPTELPGVDPKSWIQEIPMQMQQSGMQRHRIWLADSLRTSQNTKAMRLARLWLQLALRSKTKQIDESLKKARHFAASFFNPLFFVRSPARFKNIVLKKRQC
mgnify:CR=1 FL=1